MKVKLKSVREIHEAGFRVRQKLSPPGEDMAGGRYVDLVDSQNNALPLDLVYANELQVVPQGSIKKDDYDRFESAFEVIEP